MFLALPVVLIFLVAGLSLLFISAAYVLCIAVLVGSRARIALEGDVSEATWAPHLWGEGWAVRRAVVLGTARDPQIVVGSVHVVEDDAGRSTSSPTPCARIVMREMREDHATLPRAFRAPEQVDASALAASRSSVESDRSAAAPRVNAVRLITTQNCVELSLEDVDNCISPLLQGGAPTRARFEDGASALLFLRNLCPRAHLIASRTASLRPFSEVPSRREEASTETRRRSTCAEAARPTRMCVAAPQPAVESALERLRAPVELRMWIVKTGDRVLLMHMSWSVLTLLRIYARAAVSFITRCSSCTQALSRHPERDLEVSLSPDLRRYITIAPLGSSCTLAYICVTNKRIILCAISAAISFLAHLLSRRAVETVGVRM